MTRRGLTVRRSGLVLAMAFSLFLAGALPGPRGRNPRAVGADVSSGSTQSVYFAYWTVENGFDSSVGFNNATAFPIVVYPVLYSPFGEALAVDPIVLQARRPFGVRISDWLRENHASPRFTHGSLSFSYQGVEDAVGSQVEIQNPDTHQSFDIRDVNINEFKSSRLESLWWQPEGDSDYDLIVTNTTSAWIEAAVSFSGEHGQRDQVTMPVEVGPHGSRILSLRDLDVPFTTGTGPGKAGGITITHGAAPGSIIAYGLLNTRRGISSHFTFDDPAASKSQSLAAAHIMIGEPDIPGFDGEASFTTVTLVRNNSGSAIEVSPKVSFQEAGRAETVSLARISLAPQALASIDVGAELRRAGHRGPFAGAGLTLEQTGETGALTAHVTSFERSGSMAFTLPLKDPALRSSRFGGTYPWTLEGDTRSIIHIRNTTDQPSRFTVQLDFDGGSYALPLQRLDPQQERAIDIRALRDNQVKDSIGRTIPLSISAGQVTWSEHGLQALIGREEVYSINAGTSSSLSCETPFLCPPSTQSVDLSPPPTDGVVGDSMACVLLETQYRASDGATFGPYDVTSSAMWTSSDPAVVTVAPGTVSFVGTGLATIIAAFQGIVWLGDPSTELCIPNETEFQANAPVTVTGSIEVSSATFTLPDPPAIPPGGSATLQVILVGNHLPAAGVPISVMVEETSVSGVVGVSNDGPKNITVLEGVNSATFKFTAASQQPNGFSPPVTLKARVTASLVNSADSNKAAFRNNPATSGNTLTIQKTQ